MKNIKLEKIGLIIVFVLVITMMLYMAYQVGVECYNAVAR